MAVIKSNEFTNYNWGDTRAPEGFDPNATGFAQPPPGEHLMEIADFAYEQARVWKYKDQQQVLNQLRPLWKVVSGAYAGAGLWDFLPMPPPPPGQQMITFLANRWGQFLVSLGYDLPLGQLVPAGFRLKDIIGRRALVRVVIALDETGAARKQPNGEPQHQVALFGYREAPRGDLPSPQPATQKTAPSSAPTTAPADFEL